MATERDDGAAGVGEYAAMFEASPDGILVADEETGTIRDANDAATTLFGHSRERLQQLTLGDLAPADATDEQWWREAADDGRTTWEVESGDGTVQVDVTLATADDGSGRLFVFCRDHPRSAESAAEQEIREQKERLETLIEHLPVVLFALSPDGTFTLSRGRGLDHLGMEPGELNGVSATDAYADNPDVCEAVEQALAGESVRRMQEVNGRVVETQYRPVTGDDGDLQQVIGVSLDVTEQQRQEQQLETLLSAIPAGVFMTRANGEISYLNDAAREIFDITTPNPQGEQLRELLAADQLATVADHHATAIERGESVEQEHTFETAAGERTVRTVLAPVTDATGETYAVVGVANDITGRKARERRLEENDTSLTQLTEATDDVFFLFDGDFSEVQFVNDAYEDIWGRSVEALEADAMNFMEGVHPDDRDIVLGAIENLQSGESTDHEYRVNAEEGYERWVSVRAEPVFDEDGNVERVAGFARDVTERKERERALERSERQFEAVFNDPQLLVGLLDTDGRIRRVNDTALSHAAADRETIEGTPFAETPWWNHDDKLQVQVREWLDRAADGEYVEFEAEHPLPGGGEMSIEGTLRPVTDDDGTVRSLIASSRDVTERRERERQLAESNERLEKFAYVASHDLQEPLRTISNYIELIEDEYGEELDEEAERLIDVVVTGSERMQSMINGLLDYSRVTTRGKEFEPVDTAAVVGGVESDLGVLLEEYDGRLEYDDLPTVEADRNQLQQVFQNLVKNALEHSGDDPVTVIISGTDTGDGYQFEVADDGPGIAENRQEKIFRIFKSGKQYQTSSQAKGIGLAICDNIVQRHGGEIWVESEPGEGATFVFTIKDQ